MFFAAATSHAVIVSTKNKITIISQTTTETCPKTLPNISSFAMYWRIESKKAPMTQPNTNDCPIQTKKSCQSPKFKGSNDTDIWIIMIKQQHTTTFMYDAWKKKRRHKSVQKYAEIKTTARIDRHFNKKKNTAKFLYNAWNKKKRHKGVWKYHLTEINEQNVSDEMEQKIL